MASNVDVQALTYGRGCLPDSVCLYDSGRASTVSLLTKNYICSFLRPKCETLHFELMNIQGQSNSYDCGVFALSCATELAHGGDPVLCRWNISCMRGHLIQCLEEGNMKCFPKLERRRVPLGMRVRKSIVDNIYCICRMPNNKTRAMIQCVSCMKWYHKDCMSLDPQGDFKGKRWTCFDCENILEQAKI